MIYLDNNKINKTNYNKIYLGDVNIHQNLSNDKPKVIDFSYEFDNIDDIFSINNVEYTATTTPYSVNTKEDLKIDKIEEINFNISYVTKLNKFPDMSNVKTLSRTFEGAYSLNYANLSNMNASRADSTSYMFSNCSKLTTVDFSGSNLSNVRDLSYMFKGCSKLTNVNFNGCITNEGDYTPFIPYMFSGCNTLTELDLSEIKPSISAHKLDFSNTFEMCGNLTKLNLNGWYIVGANFNDRTFFRCRKLNTIYMKNSNTESVNKMKEMLTQSRIPEGQVTIIAE